MVLFNNRNNINKDYFNMMQAQIINKDDWYYNAYELCSLLAILFLYAYEANFFQGLLKNKDSKR
jgi:hypothetical protein